MDREHFIIGYLLLLVFWNIIESCLNNITNNSKILKNNILFNLFLLIVVTSILIKIIIINLILITSNQKIINNKFF